MFSGLHALPASAQQPQDDLLGVIASALDEADAPLAAQNENVELPRTSEDSAVLGVRGRTLEMSIPATGEVETQDGSTVVFAGRKSDVAVQSTSDGMRAVIHIDSPRAPERYEFEIGGDAVALEPTPDGGVVALDTNGNVLAVAPAPWAIDADGTHVPTYFEIEDTTLYQVIEHRNGNHAYGIVADPWWNPFSWNWSEIISSVASATKSAKSWLGTNANWLKGKAWSASKKTVKIGGRAVRVLAKKAGPLGLVLCATGGGWAWFRSDASGWVRVGDAIGGCFL